MAVRSLLGTRAVLRPILPAASGVAEAFCEQCGQPVRFTARRKANRVIANVYGPNGWERVEHFHECCYDEAGKPHGEARP